MGARACGSPGGGGSTPDYARAQQGTTGIVSRVQSNEDRVTRHWETQKMTSKLGRRHLAGAAALLPAAALIGPAHAQPANESTFDRVRRTKTLRIAALPGELPYFQKDIATGE